MPDEISLNNNPGSLEPRNLLSNIKSVLYGNQNEPRIDYVDSALSRISSYIVSKNARNQAELMRSVMTKSLEKEDFDTIPGSMITDIETMGRLSRYVNASEIIDNIPYCARALQVLADGVVSPDDITKQTIQVLPIEQSSEQDKTQLALAKDIIKKLDIDIIVWDVVYETLKNGDQFVEICDYRSKDVPITQSLLTENSGLTSEEIEKTMGVSEHEITIKYSELTENTNQIDEKEINFTVELEIIQEEESNPNDEIAEILQEDLMDVKNSLFLGTNGDKEFEVKKNDGPRKTELGDIRILLHNPGNVIKIQSKRHRMCLGYLVLPEFDSGYNPFFGSSPAGSSSGKSAMNFGLTSLMPNTNSLNGIDSLYKDMIEKIKKYVKNDEIFVNKKDVMTLLKRAINEVDTDSFESKNVPFKVRFVPVNRMEHFMIPSQRFFPYGEGIFYKSTFQCKLFIALETAITIKRLSDSVDKRVIYVESGLPREARTIIEELKTTMKKRKFSIDSLGTVGTVPSMISAYEDIYIPQTHGKRFVEFDTLQSNIQVQDVVDQLKNFRDTIIAGLQVPPSYLNIEENLSNKCLSSAVLINLTSGHKITLGELIKEYEETGKIENKWAYSYDKETGKIVPGKISWAGYTRKNAEVVRVNLDNEKFIECTPDHKFMLRTGEYKEAKDLSSGESLMPFYSRLTNTKTNIRKIPYLQIYQPGIDRWELVHSTLPEIKEKNRLGELFGEKNSGCFWSEESKKRKSSKKINYFKNKKEKELLNHKVVSVEFLEQRIDTGDITVDVYHNFAIEDSVIVSNSALSFENAIFAQTVVTYQFAFSKRLHSLISKIMVLLQGRKLKDSVIITFPPPKMLQMERDAEKYDMVARIVQALSDMGISKKWAVHNYLDLPWEDIKNFDIKSKTEEKITPPDDADMMGGMGMGGIGGIPPMNGAGTGFV